MILVYHHVAPPDAVPAAPDASEGWQFTLSPQGFERQLTELRRRGYQFVPLARIVDDIDRAGAEDPRSVAVTFDDGWVDNCQFALPVLKKFSIPATFFVTTGHIHNGAADSKRMSVVQLREMLSAGMTVGGHTRSHTHLTRLAPEAARAEIGGCKEDLQRALGVDVRFFAYPGGAFNRDVARLTQEAGYTAACSVLGPARNAQSSLFWLYREVLSEGMDTWHDWYRLSPLARRLFSFRVTRKLTSALNR